MTPTVVCTPQIKTCIIGSLNQLGVPANLQGYEYLKSAIEILLETPQAIRRITTELYPKIAEEHQTTTKRVERSIRHAIEVAFDRTSIENLHSVFGGCISLESGRVTNAEFVSILTEKIRVELGAYDEV